MWKFSNHIDMNYCVESSCGDSDVETMTSISFHHLSHQLTNINCQHNETVVYAFHQHKLDVS